MTARKILIVEDESVVRLHLRRIVEKMGHQVVGLASNYGQALDLARTQVPDLVLMDIHLQGHPDGIDTAKEIVQRHGCAIVFATAFADDETLRRTQEAGAVGYVLKPFSERSVHATLATALLEHDRLTKSRVQEQALKGIIGSMGEAVLQLDEGMNVKFMNPAAASLAWAENGDPIGRRLHEVLHPGPDDIDSFLLALDAALNNGGRAAMPAFSHQNRDGSEVLIKGTIEPITPDVPNGGDPGYVVTLRDLSQRAAVSLEGSPGESSDPSLDRDQVGPRLLIYSHDTFGLGHLRRSLNLASSLVKTVPGLSIILVTGSALAHRFPLPAGVDYVKLPAVRKMASEKYSSRSLSVSDEDVLSIRSNLLLRVVRDFRPNVLLADHSPAGMKGELVPALNWLRDHLPECRTVVGLRDITDDPETVKETWRQQGVFDLLRESYDHLVIYGDRKIFDPVSAYGFGEDLAGRTRFLGHVTEPEDFDDAGRNHGSLPRIVVTTGGGDGAVAEVAGGVLNAVAEGYLNTPVELTVLPGPLADEELLADLKATAAQTNAQVLDFVDSSSPYMAGADLVVCTAGYNTATQVLRHAKRALMIPRVMHRKEQLLRATRLSELGLVRYLHPDHLDPRTLGDTISQCLAATDNPLVEARANKEFNFDGAEAFARFCAQLLQGSKEPTEATHD